MDHNKKLNPQSKDWGFFVQIKKTVISDGFSSHYNCAWGL